MLLVRVLSRSGTLIFLEIFFDFNCDCTKVQKVQGD